MEFVLHLILSVCATPFIGITSAIFAATVFLILGLWYKKRYLRVIALSLLAVFIASSIASALPMYIGIFVPTYQSHESVVEKRRQSASEFWSSFQKIEAGLDEGKSENDRANIELTAALNKCVAPCTFAVRRLKGGIREITFSPECFSDGQKIVCSDDVLYVDELVRSADAIKLKGWIVKEGGSEVTSTGGK